MHNSTQNKTNQNSTKLPQLYNTLQPNNTLQHNTIPYNTLPDNIYLTTYCNTSQQFTRLYNTLQYFRRLDKTLHKFTKTQKTSQNFTKLSQSLYTTLQGLHKTLHIFFKKTLYETAHNYTQLCKTIQTLQDFTQLYKTLQICANMYPFFGKKLWQNSTALDTTLQHFTQFNQLYNTLHYFTQTLQNNYTTLHNYTALDTHLQHFHRILQNCTQFCNFTWVYTSWQHFATLDKTLHTLHNHT